MAGSTLIAFSLLVSAVGQSPPPLPTTYSVTVQQSVPGIGSGAKIVTVSGGNAWRHGTEITQYGMLGSVWQLNRCDQKKVYVFTSKTECDAKGARTNFDCPCPAAPSPYGGTASCSDFDISLGYLAGSHFISTGPCQVPGGAGQICDVYGFTLLGNTFEWGVLDAGSVPKYAKLSFTSMGVTLTATATFSNFNTDMSLCTASGVPCYDMHVPSACGGPKPKPTPTPTPPTPTPPSPGHGCADPKCSACCTGACLPCKACIGIKTGGCAACYAIDPTAGTACLYDDGHGCQRCWNPSPPSPPSPAPPSPTPPPPSPPSPPSPCLGENKSCEDKELRHSCCEGLKCKKKSGKHVCTGSSTPSLTNVTQVAMDLFKAKQAIRSALQEKYGADPGPMLFL